MNLNICTMNRELKQFDQLSELVQEVVMNFLNLFSFMYTQKKDS